MEGLIGPEWDGTFPIRTYFDEILAGTGNDQLPDDFLINDTDQIVPGTTTTTTTSGEESKDTTQDDSSTPPTTTDDNHSHEDCELCTFCDTCGGCPNCCSCNDSGKLA